MNPCPRCGHNGNVGGAVECARCGVVFHRFLQRQAQQAEREPPPPEMIEAPPSEPQTEPHGVMELFLWVPPHINALNFWARLATWTVLLGWSGWFLGTSWKRADIMESFLHRVDLVFHEAGHIFFAPFGQLMMFLGGSLMQCLVPLLCAGSFLWRRNPFAAAACLWWLGQNLLDLAPYVGDARLMSLPLIGEWSDDAIDARAERHDWHNILRLLGWLKRDDQLANAFAVGGWTTMALALTWGALVLRKQFPRRSDVLDE
ncbi:MAG: hypothetical protein AB2A00_02485 [Myxococcota bacterium]